MILFCVHMPVIRKGRKIGLFDSNEGVLSNHFFPVLILIFIFLYWLVRHNSEKESLDVSQSGVASLSTTNDIIPLYCVHVQFYEPNKFFCTILLYSGKFL